MKPINSAHAKEWLRLSVLFGRRKGKILSSEDRQNFFQKLATAKPSEILLPAKVFQNLWRRKLAKYSRRVRRDIANRKKRHPRG